MYEQDETMAHPMEMDDAQATEEAPLSEASPTAEISDGDGHNPIDVAGADEATLGGGGEETEEMGADPADPAASTQSFDPSAQAPDTDQTTDSELEHLRRELNEFRAQLEGQAREMQRIGMEYAEFCELYPNRSPEEIPDDVWESVRRGVPLSAAYALSERKRYRTQEKARQLNEANRRRSSGSVEGTSNGYFSADEVRAMTQSEVRANYQKILLSMQKWQ